MLPLVILLCASALVSGAGYDGDCDFSAPVEKFAASVYTALIVTNDPNFIDNYSAPGGKAGMHLYNIVKKVFDEANLCSADEIAFLAGRAVARAGNFTLPRFFKNVVYTIGQLLLKNKVLDCANAIQLALEYFGYYEKETEGLDKRQLDSYILGVMKAYGDLLAAHHLDLGAVSMDGVHIFSEVTEDGNGKKKCQNDEEEKDAE